MEQSMLEKEKASVPSFEANQVIKVEYTNWRGESAIRTIVPINLKWRSTEWHPKAQWLLKVWDVDRNDYREYALKDITKFL